MNSLRQLAFSSQTPPDTASVRTLGKQAFMPSDISLLALLKVLTSPVHLQAEVVTPTGTALGGNVDIFLAFEGTYTFQVHMHDSGFDPYDFRVRCAVSSPSGLVLLFQVSGHTDGTGSTVLGEPERDFDHDEPGSNPLIQAYWLDVRTSSMSVNKSYDDSGLLHTVEDIAKDLVGFLIADVTLGVGLALVICVSAEISNAVGANFVGPGGLVGIAVAGGLVWMFGPAALIPAIVAGVAAGAVTDAVVAHKQLTEEQYQFANIVFSGTLPPRERIYVTNLSTSSGRFFTWPNVDQSILLNLGAAFDDPVNFLNDPYTIAGQAFIHELTHAWQYQTKSFTTGVICKYVSQTRTYVVESAGKAWQDYGVEQQAAIVDHWYATYARDWVTPADVAARLSANDAITDPYFRFIANNIRLGQN